MCAVKPVFGGTFAHAEDLRQSADHIVLKERKGITGGQPRCAVLFLKYPTELDRLALFFDKLLQFGDLQIFAVKAQIVIKHLGKYTKNSCFVLWSGTLHVNVEENGVRFSTGDLVHRHERSGVVLKFLAETLHGLYALHFFVLQEIGEHFQKVGFAAAKEAGNPHADIGDIFFKGLAVIIEKRDKVLFQFLRDDIFLQLLHENGAFILLNLDYAIDFAVNVLGEHIFYHHKAHLLHYIKGSIIRIGRQFVEQSYIAAVKCPRVHDQDWHIGKMRLHGIQKRMDTDKGKRLPHARDENDIADVMRLRLHFFDKGEIVCYTRQVSQDECMSLFIFQIGDFVRDALILANGKKHLVKVVFYDAAARANTLRQFFRKMPDSHFILGMIAKNANIDLVGQPFSVEKVLTLHQLPKGVKALVQFAHPRILLFQTVESRQGYFLPGLSYRTFQNRAEQHGIQSLRFDAVQIPVFH